MDYAKSHGRKVADLMSEEVISASESTPISELATLFERHRIKRLPIVRDGKLVGVVSRSKLIQALASEPAAAQHDERVDRPIKLDILDCLRDQSWTGFGERNIVVANVRPGVQSIADEMIPSY